MPIRPTSGQRRKWSTWAGELLLADRAKKGEGQVDGGTKIRATPVSREGLQSWIESCKLIASNAFEPISHLPERPLRSRGFEGSRPFSESPWQFSTILAVNKIQFNDYSLVGRDTAAAIEKGLAEATWYASPVPRHEMRELLERRDGPAIRDTLLWFALILGSGIGGFVLWGTWWAVFPFAVYSILYASTSGSRWHESGHGTAFKTDWMNNALYEIASFMGVKNATRWRWSHARHHSDTIIVGRDPEIAVTRPPKLFSVFLTFVGVSTALIFFGQTFRHCIGRLSREERAFIPESEHGKLILRARIYLLIYASVIGLAIYTWQRPSADVLRAAKLLRHVARHVLQRYPARGSCPECARPSAQLPDDLHRRRSTASFIGI